MPAMKQNRISTDRPCCSVLGTGSLRVLSTLHRQRSSPAQLTVTSPKVLHEEGSRAELCQKLLLRACGEQWIVKDKATLLFIKKPKGFMSRVGRLLLVCLFFLVYLWWGEGGGGKTFVWKGIWEVWGRGTKWHLTARATMDQEQSCPKTAGTGECLWCSVTEAMAVP